MNSLLAVVIGVAVALMAIGFWCGWFVRGGEVKKLKAGYERLMQHAVAGGWVVSEKELMENLAKHGVYVPYVPATFSTAGEKSQADTICELLEEAKKR